MKKIAILVDLELKGTAGGHVKFWERISYSIRNLNLGVSITIFFLGKKVQKKKIGKHITFCIIKPTLSSEILIPFGVDADSTDLFPINLKLLFILKDFDLIHSTDQLFSMATTATIASRVWKIPLTTSLHTDTPSYTEYYVKKIFKKFPNFFFYFFIEKLKLHKKIQNNQKKKLRNYLKYCEEAMINDHISIKSLEFPESLKKKISKLSRGVNKAIFYKKKVSKEKVLRKYNIQKNEKILFFCGRIHELKGAVFLSEVHNILKKNNVKVVSILAGQDIHGEKCLEKGGDKIRLIGHVEESQVADLYNICDLFVFPSKYEIGPQVVLEAKACGAICLVSPSGGGKRIKKNGVDGIIIDDYAPNVWAKNIIKILGDRKKTVFMKRKILKEFKPLSWEDVFNKYFLCKWNKIIK